MYWQFGNPDSLESRFWLFVYSFPATNDYYRLGSDLHSMGFNCGYRMHLPNPIDINIIREGDDSLEMFFGISGLVTVNNNLEPLRRLGIEFESYDIRSDSPYFADKKIVNFVGLESLPCSRLLSEDGHPYIIKPSLDDSMCFEKEIFRMAENRGYLIVSDRMKKMLLLSGMQGLSEDFFRPL